MTKRLKRPVSSPEPKTLILPDRVTSAGVLRAAHRLRQGGGIVLNRYRRSR